MLTNFKKRDPTLIRRWTMEKLIALLTVLSFLLGCASTTLIKSNPPGAKLQVDGQVMGETPHFYTDKAAAGTSENSDFKKGGLQRLQ
jgi:hypothetical protein